MKQNTVILNAVKNLTPSVRDASASLSMTKSNGFSLVELAIVLVIIGLIVGGILTGQDLIRASELNSVIAEKNKFQTAINTFKIKYNGLPGDMNNAVSYWSTSANGDGDGAIETNNESYRAWQQLSLSGLISGAYTGTHTTGGSILDTNTPASALKPGGWAVFSDTAGWSDSPLAAAGINKLHLGVTRTTGIPIDDILTPQEANSIDSKIDDGLPTRGKMFGTWIGVADCISAATAAGVYNLSVTTATCGITFIIN